MVCKAHQGLAFAHLNSPLFQNERFFLMQTTFKVFIEFFFYHIVSVYVLVFWPQGISSPTWDQTCSSCIGRRSQPLDNQGSPSPFLVVSVPATLPLIHQHHSYHGASVSSAGKTLSCPVNFHSSAQQSPPQGRSLPWLKSSDCLVIHAYYTLSVSSLSPAF